MDAHRMGQRRISRRRLLGAAGILAGAGGLAAVGCNSDSKPQSVPSPFDIQNTEPTATTPSGTVRTTLSDRHGETLRYTGYVSGDGVFDPHKTQAAPLSGQQALVYSKLLRYQNQADGTVIPDLAVAMPERPDLVTLIFRLNPAARWNDREPLNGRPVTAQDVVYSIERQMHGDATFVRKNRWAVVENVEAVSESEVKVTLKGAFANAESLFADVSSFVVPHEIADGGLFAGATQPGSGPFRWVEWNDGTFASVARNSDWHGGDQRPFLDGIELRQPKDDADIEAGLRTKKLDAVYVGRKLADRLKENIPQLVELQAGQSLYFGMRFFLNQVPYNDLRFRTALALSIDRRTMVDRFFGGAGEINPWVSSPMRRWALPQSELSNIPGYRPGTGGREADIGDAKAQLAAFASDQQVPEELPLFVEAAAEQNLGLGTVMKEQITGALGINVKVVPMQIGDLIKWMFEGNAPWVAGPDTGWIDLDDWVYPYFHSAGTANSFPIRDPDLNQLIENQRGELNEENRQQIGYEIQRRIMALHAGENFVSEKLIALTWPYVKGFPMDTQDGYQHRFADTWIDRNDPSFRGR